MPSETLAAPAAETTDDTVAALKKRVAALEAKLMRPNSAKEAEGGLLAMLNSSPGHSILLSALNAWLEQYGSGNSVSSTVGERVREIAQAAAMEALPSTEAMREIILAHARDRGIMENLLRRQVEGLLYSQLTENSDLRRDLMTALVAGVGEEGHDLNAAFKTALAHALTHNSTLSDTMSAHMRAAARDRLLEPFTVSRAVR